jgi:hypothetical protein
VGAAGRVAIGICTARRPELLKSCLSVIAAQVIPNSVGLTLTVSDNEPEPNNREAVEAFAAAPTTPSERPCGPRIRSTGQRRWWNGEWPRMQLG